MIKDMHKSSYQEPRQKFVCSFSEIIVAETFFS